MNEQEQTCADIGQEQEQEQEHAAPTMADAARLLAVLAESRMIGTSRKRSPRADYDAADVFADAAIELAQIAPAIIAEIVAAGIAGQTRQAPHDPRPDRYHHQRSYHAMTAWNATTIAAGDYSALPTLPGVLVGQEYGFSDPGRPAPTGTVWVPIQRDDEAATYESDEDAADAYARAVGAPPDPDTGQPLAIWGVTRQEDDPDEPADMFVAVPIGAAAGIAGQTRQAPRESTIVPTIDDRGVVELPSSSPLATVCGSCGRGWLDEHTSDATPAPSGRCPFEYDHPDEDSSIR